MVYVFIGIGVFVVIAFSIYISLTSNKHKVRKEYMKEEHAHRDFMENNPRAGQNMFKHRFK